MAVTAYYTEATYSEFQTHKKVVADITTELALLKHRLASLENEK